MFSGGFRRHSASSTRQTRHTAYRLPNRVLRRAVSVFSGPDFVIFVMMDQRPALPVIGSDKAMPVVNTDNLKAASGTGATVNEPAGMGMVRTGSGQGCFQGQAGLVEYLKRKSSFRVKWEYVRVFFHRWILQIFYVRSPPSSGLATIQRGCAGVEKTPRGHVEYPAFPVQRKRVVRQEVSRPVSGMAGSSSPAVPAVASSAPSRRDYAVRVQQSVCRLQTGSGWQHPGLPCRSF